MNRKILPGKPYPQGATSDGTGVNFAVYSENAATVELCLFESQESGTAEVISLRETTGYTWHCYLPGLMIGQLYRYRVHGRYEPELGLRFNPAKLLIDPYAKAVTEELEWNAPVFGYELGGSDEDLTVDRQDDARGMPKAVITTPLFDWQNDRAPSYALHDSVIYELHVKGFTAEHPEGPPELRGTYAALTVAPVIDYFRKLGVTALELMPIHDFLDDKHLVEQGLNNYWGYNTTSFFAPAARYSSSRERGQQVGEFKTMVRELHRAGIEVILDVVYNHTSEGNHLGPTLNFRGFDNTTYYRLVPDNPRYYMDYTGTGNTLNLRHPHVLKLVMDSLRYWILEMHVDGFRFDLAAALARELHDVDRLSAFFDVIHQDPVVSQVKLIAEPWDVGEGGYQVGQFPALWAEWNGKYRDCVRRYWKGDGGHLADLGYRLTGSSDLYQRDGRRPSASINFVTAHDGFTLHDLVSFGHKRNEATREENRDGTNDNYSWNCGTEGPTEDSGITDLRERQKRSLMATLLLSQGVPMISSGDEIGRTQGGNNNAYCQHNESSWLNWSLNDRQKHFLEFTRQAIAMRLGHPNFHRRKFFQDRRINPAGVGIQQVEGETVRDVVWYRPDGEEMTNEEWDSDWVRCVGLFLSGKTLDDVDRFGEWIRDGTMLLFLNSHFEDVGFTLPGCLEGRTWRLVLDTRNASVTKTALHECRSVYTLVARSVAVFEEVETSDVEVPTESMLASQ